MGGKERGIGGGVRDGRVQGYAERERKGRRKKDKMTVSDEQFW